MYLRDGIVQTAKKYLKKQSIPDQVFDLIKGYIDSGRFQAGDKIPSENELCKQLGGNWRSAARAGLLHDLFLYDWHTHAKETGQYFHGFTHPKAALENADRYFRLTGEERMIILRHMWPLTLIPPTSKAGYAVTCADKYCSTVETTARFKHWIRMCLFAQPARR